MSAAGAVFRKEMLDSARDRRSLLSLLLFPLVGPVLVSLMLSRAITGGDSASGADIACAVVGRERAPGLVAHLERHGVEVQAVAEEGIEARVRDGDVDVALVIEPAFARDYRAGEPATVTLIYDDARAEAHRTIGQVRGLLQTHAATVGTLRLLARGVNPKLGQPLVIDEVDLSTRRARAAPLLGFIAMFVLLAAFLGGMYTATDATAGERERGSLEPLLITPVGRRALVMGKWGAAVVFSAATTVLTLTATLVALSRVPVQRLGFSLSIAPLDVVWVLVAVLPLTLFITAAQLLVASFAHSFKEAQTYLSLMVFLPMLPALLTMLNPVKTKLWMTLVPVLGQQVLLNDVIKGTAVDPLRFVIAALASTAAALVCIQITAALYRREGVIFGRS